MASPTNPTGSGASTANPIERRRNLRFPFSATVEVVDSKTETKITGRTSDLSLGGCYVDTLSPFPVGTEAKIRIIRGNEAFEAQVRVVYSLVGMGMGLAFVSAQPKQVRLFQRWLQEISGQGVAEEEKAPSETAPAEASAESTQTFGNYVLSELIMTLMQKKILTEAEGKDFLRKLFR
jgi:hypothetical protein